MKTISDQRVHFVRFCFVFFFSFLCETSRIEFFSYFSSFARIVSVSFCFHFFVLLLGCNGNKSFATMMKRNRREKKINLWLLISRCTLYFTSEFECFCIWIELWLIQSVRLWQRIESICDLQRFCVSSKWQQQIACIVSKMNLMQMWNTNANCLYVDGSKLEQFKFQNEYETDERIRNAPERKQNTWQRCHGPWRTLQTNYICESKISQMKHMVCTLVGWMGEKNRVVCDHVECETWEFQFCNTQWDGITNLNWNRRTGRHTNPWAGWTAEKRQNWIICWRFVVIQRISYPISADDSPSSYALTAYVELFSRYLYDIQFALPLSAFAFSHSPIHTQTHTYIYIDHCT